MSTTCLIFDMDGTLVDSETKCIEALTLVIPELSLTVPELSKRYRGVKLTHIFEDIEKNFRIDLSEDIVTDYRKAYDGLLESGVAAFPGVVEFLVASHLPRCIASNAPLFKVRKTLQKSGLATFFSERSLFSAYDIGAWKPEPKLFLEAAKTMGFAASDCLVVEDSQAGIDAAIAAGMRVVQFCEPDAVPLLDAHITDLRQLPSYC